MKNLIQKYGKDFFNNEEYKQEQKKNMFAYRQIRDEFDNKIRKLNNEYKSRNDYIMMYDN